MGFLTILLSIFVIITYDYNVKADNTALFCETVTNVLTNVYCSIKYSNCQSLHDSLTINFYHYPKNSNKVLIEKNTLDPNKRTTIIIHGYLSSSKAGWIKPMVDALHNWEDMNVIVVEWFKHIDYHGAASTVSEVATRSAKMISEELFANRRDKSKNYIHIIGHSLGAHIAGLTATKLNSTDWTVDRVTGLDPAKPAFDSENDKAYRLNSTCAEFVDVIHTNSGFEESPTFGLHETMGDIDFYPNRGDDQPACRLFESNPNEGRTFDDLVYKCAKKTLEIKNVPELAMHLFTKLIHGKNMVCNHEMAAYYFTESLLGEKSVPEKRKFYATRTENPLEPLSCGVKIGCSEDDSCAEMGIYAQNHKQKRPGKYLLGTNCDYKTADNSQLTNLVNILNDINQKTINFNIDDFIIGLGILNTFSSNLIKTLVEIFQDFRFY